MSSIGVILSSEDPVLHKIDGNTLVTQNGTYAFTKIVESEDFSASLNDNYTLKTTFIVRPKQSGHSEGSSSFEKTVASMVLRRILGGITSYVPTITVCDFDSHMKFNSQDGLSSIMNGKQPISAGEAHHILESPMKSAIRATIIDSRYQIFEVVCYAKQKFESLTGGVAAVLHAVTTQADYVPYRENILTKLLWPAIQDPTKALTAIICIPTHDLSAQQPFFELSTRMYSWIESKAPVRSFNSAPLSLTGVQDETAALATIDVLKIEVAQQLDTLLNLYVAELMRQSIEMMKGIEDHKMEAIRSMADLKRSKRDEIDALDRKISLLEAQISVFSKNSLENNSTTTGPSPGPGTSTSTDTSTRSEQSWFSSELERKQQSLAQLRNEESDLLEKIAASRTLEVVEPFKGLIRQTEFNLNSLKTRLEVLRIKSNKINVVM